MNKKYRNIFFLTMVFIFLVSTGTILFFETGHRYDLDNKRIIYVGSMTIRTDPKGAEIFLNGEKQKYSTPVVINNLLPGEYTLGIKKTGYLDWGKDVEVKQQQATIVSNILLFKSDIVNNPVEKDISLPTQTQDKTDVVFTKKNDVSTELIKMNINNGKIEKLENTEEKILDIKVPDVNNIILKKEKDEKSFWVWKVEDKTFALDEIFTENNGDIDLVAINPKNEKNIFIRSENTLWSITRENEIITIKKIDEKIMDFKIVNNEIVYLQGQKGTVSLNIMDVHTSKKQSFETNFSDERTEVVKGFKEKIFLKDMNKELYVFDKEKKVFEKLNIHADHIVLREKDDKLIAWNQNEVWLISINRTDEFEKKLIARQTKIIEDILWYPESSYILKSDETGITVINTEENGTETNIYPLPAQKMYMHNTETLYIIDAENNILKMDIR